MDALEEEAVQVCIGDGEVQMRICEEPLDLSFIASLEAGLLEGASVVTDVGGVHSGLSDRAASCMLRSLCEASPLEANDPLEEDLETESIFNPGSKMGLEAKDEEDRWEYDSSKATWTCIIVVPRTLFFHPSEGAADEGGNLGPRLSNLRSYRWTLADGIPPIKDDWEKEPGELEADGRLLEWTGKVVFGEKWASADDEEDLEEDSLHKEVQGLEKKSRGRPVALSPCGSVSLPNDLVFQDIPERNVVGDLSGKLLEGVQVTAAKHEEITEIYRRQVWVERPTSDCFRDTGKLPIPVRWVVTNKGNELHPNVRCRLVAKHLAAKYGGKNADDRFAAMPPFELIKSLLIKAVQRNSWRTQKRKVMFIDISKAHLYARVDAGTCSYADLPRSAISLGRVGCCNTGFTECARPPIGGRRNIRDSWKLLVS